MAPVVATSPAAMRASECPARVRPHQARSRLAEPRPAPAAATFEVTWAEDSDRFYARVLSAVMRDGAFRGIPADQFNAVSTGEPQPFRTLVADFHQAYAMRHSDRSEKAETEDSIQARTTTPDPEMYSSSLTGKKLSLVEQAPAAKPGRGDAIGADRRCLLWRDRVARTPMAAEADRGGCGRESRS